MMTPNCFSCVGRHVLYGSSCLLAYEIAPTSRHGVILIDYSFLSNRNRMN